MPWSEARQPSSWKSMPLVERGNEAGIAVDGHVGGGRKAGDRRALQASGSSTAMALSGRKLGTITRFARLPFWQRRQVDALQRVGRIVGGADGAHVHAHQQAPGAELGASCQLGVTRLPDHRRGLLREHGVDAEITLQFEVRPVVERVTDQRRDGFRPREKVA